MQMQQDVPDGYKWTEVGVIPEGWEVQNVREAYDICNNLRAPISSKIRERMQGVYPYYGPTKIQDYLNEYRVDGEYALIGEDGDHFLKFDTMPQTQLAQGKFNVNNHAHLIKGRKNLTAWFYFFFRNRDISVYLSRQGAGRYKLNKGTLETLPCILPPISEQAEIVSVLHDVDACIISIEKLIAKKRVIKTATMQQLLTGKKRLPPFDKSHTGYKQSELGEIPEDWAVNTINNLFKITAGGDLRKSEYSSEQTQNSPFPIYSNSLSEMGLYGFCQTYDYDDDCLTITARGGIGHAEERSGKFCAIGRLLVLKPYLKMSCKFVAEYINQYLAFASESTGVPQLTAPQVGSYMLVVPSPEEQEQIAEVLVGIDRDISLTKRQLKKTQQLKQGMMQELLTGKTRLLAGTV